MWWLLLLGILGTVIYIIYFLVVETRCPYCHKQFGKRLIASEPKSSTVSLFLMNAREERNSYFCRSCREDWWIDRERSSRSRRFAFSVLAYLDSDDPIKAYFEQQGYEIKSFVESLGRIETLVGGAVGAVLVLLGILDFGLAYYLLTAALATLMPLIVALFWLVRRFDFLPVAVYEVMTRLAIGIVLGGLIVYLFSSLFKRFSS